MCIYEIYLEEVSPGLTSKTCNNCGSINNDLTLENRDYNCLECGYSNDRDYNATLNILDKSIYI